MGPLHCPLCIGLGVLSVSRAIAMGLMLARVMIPDGPAGLARQRATAVGGPGSALAQV